MTQISIGPVITNPRDGHHAAVESLILRGQAPADSQIWVVDQGRPVGRTVSDRSGSWSINHDDVVPGQHVYVAMLVHPTGVVSSPAVCVTVAPELPVPDTESKQKLRSNRVPEKQGGAEYCHAWLARISPWIEMDLLIIGLVVLLGVPLAIVVGGLLRVACGLAMVLLFPGYTLTAAVFPSRNELEPVERLALSVGLSVATSLLIGLGLHFGSWGTGLSPALPALTLFIAAMLATAYFRRRRLPPEERYQPPRRLLLSGLGSYWAKRGASSSQFALLVVACLLAVIAAAGITRSTARGGFTEFYVLGSKGKDGSYPKMVAVGDAIRIKLALVNNEQEAASYRMVITVDGKHVGQVGPFNLAAGRKWEHSVDFWPTNAEHRQRLDFLLFRGKATQLYKFLRLWIEVKSKH